MHMTPHLESVQVPQTRVQSLDPNALTDLIDRLSDAPDGSRALDVAVAEVLGMVPDPREWLPTETGTYIAIDTQDIRCVRKIVLPRWTTSLDDAVEKLEPVKDGFMVMKLASGVFKATVVPPNTRHVMHVGYANTAPLAMTAAKLRARKDGGL
jgi:hypothetical protein